MSAAIHRVGDGPLHSEADACILNSEVGCPATGNRSGSSGARAMPALLLPDSFCRIYAEPMEVEVHKFINSMRFLIVLACFLSGVSTSVFADFIDQSAQYSTLLAELEPELRAGGIDVRGSALPEGTSVGFRPQLSYLETLPAKSLAGSVVPNTFSRLFEAGAFTESYLVAVRTRAKKHPNLSETRFREMWDAAKQSDRIFLSFSGNDLAHAEKVRDALKSKGFEVFLYKDSSTVYPRTNSVDVGRYFREAGTHLVVDTYNARSSVGVISEAIALEALRAGVKPTFPGETPADARKAMGDPCCRVCTYKNGMNLGCGPVQCGPQCFGAR